MGLLLMFLCLFCLLQAGTPLSYDYNCSSFDTSTGIISSNFEENGRTCVWNFESDVGDTFILHFLEYTSLRQLFTLCRTNYLEVKDGTMADSPSIVGPKLCYIIESDSEVYTKSNGLWVKMVSQSFSINTLLKAEVRIESKWKRYNWYEDHLTWQESHDRCQTLGGGLAVSYPAPNTHLEDFVFMSPDPVWTGKSVTDWAWLLGCVRLNTRERIQPAYLQSKYNQLSECTMACRGSNFFLVQDKSCFCYKDPIIVTKVEFGKCNTDCPGNLAEKCGGENVFTQYQLSSTSTILQEMKGRRACAVLTKSGDYEANRCDILLPFSCSFKNETKTYMMALPWTEAVEFCSQQEGSYGLSTIPKLPSRYYGDSMWLGLVRGLDWGYPSVVRREPEKAFVAVEGYIYGDTTYMEQLKNTSSKYPYVCQFEKPNCGENLTVTDTDSYGNITSPDYPGPYSVGRLCLWSIEAEPQLVFIITFQQFDIEHSVDCIYDYLQITEEVDAEVKAVSPKQCGKNIPESFVVNSNHIEVVFKSDRSVTAPGFLLSWKLVDKEEARKWAERQKPTKVNPGVILGVTIAMTCIVLIILSLVFIVYRVRKKRTAVIQDPCTSSVNNAIYGMGQSEFDESSVINENFQQYENINSPKPVLSGEPSYSYENVVGCSIAVGVTPSTDTNGSKANLLLDPNDETITASPVNGPGSGNDMEKVADEETGNIAGAVLCMKDVEYMGKDAIQVAEGVDKADDDAETADGDYIPVGEDMRKTLVGNSPDNFTVNEASHKYDDIVEDDNNAYENDEDNAVYQNEDPNNKTGKGHVSDTYNSLGGDSDNSEDYERMSNGRGYSGLLLPTGADTQDYLVPQTSNLYSEVEEISQLRK